MKKEGRWFAVFLFVWSVLFAIIFLSIVQGFDIITGAPLNAAGHVPAREDVNFTINITVNNTALLAFDNITQVNVTLLTGFSFLNGTNATNATTSGYGITFTNTSTVLSWNSTLADGTGAILVANATRVNFWFLVNASTPGTYNMTVTTMNVSGFVNYTNISIIVNDTTIPNAITYQGSTPLNGSFIAARSIFVNASTYDNGAIQTITLALFNASGMFYNASGSNLSGTFNYTNTTTFSNVSQETKLNTNFSFNITNLADGVYYFNVTANDTAGNLNATTATRTVTIDTIIPVPTYGTGTEANNSFVSRNFIVVNISAIDTNFNFTNISLHNASGSIVRSNLTFASDNGTLSSFYVNFTGLNDGVYFFNVTVNDTAGNLNLSLPTRTITVDTSNPTVSLGESTSTDTTISVPITVAESGSSINGTCTTNRSTSSVSGTGGSQTLTESSLTCSTTYSYTITCYDQSGRSGAATKDFTTLGCSSGGGGGGGGGGSSPSTTPSWSVVQTVTETQVSEGVSTSLSANQKASITVSGGSHSVGVVSVDSSAGTATIEVASTPQKVTLRVGQTRQFELTNDSYYDLNVTLNSIQAGKVNVTMKKVYEIMPSAIVASDTNKKPSSENTAQESGEQKQDVGQAEKKTQKTLSSDKYVYLVVAIIVVILIVLVMRRRRR